VNLIPEYCFGVKLEEYDRRKMQRQQIIRDCPKADVENDICTVYPDPCTKMGVERGGFLGCAISPLESVSEKEADKIRVGQQKQTRKR
jgi:hypothetical protein